MNRQRLSSVITLVVALTGLMFGLMLRNHVTGRTTAVQRAGLTMEIPRGWIIYDEAADLILSARNPRYPRENITVRRILRSGGDVTVIADARGNAKARSDANYRVHGYAWTGEDGNGDYSISYSTLARDAGGFPVIIQGTEVYRTDKDNNLFIIGFESSQDRYDAFEKQFNKLLPEGGE